MKQKKRTYCPLFLFIDKIDVLFFVADDDVGSTGDFDEFGMLFGERLDMTYILVVDDFIDSDENSRLLDISESVVDSCSEEFHCR